MSLSLRRAWWQWGRCSGSAGAEHRGRWPGAGLGVLVFYPFWITAHSHAVRGCGVRTARSVSLLTPCSSPVQGQGRDIDLTRSRDSRLPPPRGPAVSSQLLAATACPPSLPCTPSVSFSWDAAAHNLRGLAFPTRPGPTEICPGPRVRHRVTSARCCGCSMRVGRSWLTLTAEDPGVCPVLGGYE